MKKHILSAILLFLSLALAAQNDRLGANLFGITVTAVAGDTFEIEGNYNDPSGFTTGNDLAAGDLLWTAGLNPGDTCRVMEIYDIVTSFAGYVVFRVDANGQGIPSTQDSKLMRPTPDNGLVYIPPRGNEALLECISQYLSFQLDAGTGGGAGDVAGPASSTDNAIPRYDGTTGKVLQNSAITIADGATPGTLSGTNTGDQTATTTPITALPSVPGATNVQTGLEGVAANAAATDALAGNLITLSGQPATSTNLGTFTGTTIPDNSTNKAALQALETYAEADGDRSATNEGALTVGAGGANTSTIVSNTSGSTAVTIAGGTNVTVTEAGSTITIAATGGAGDMIFGTHIIESTGYSLDVSGMTPYERGAVLATRVNSLGQDRWLYIPPLKFKIPASSGGLSPGSRTSIFSFDANRRANIVADSCHAFNYSATNGTYRSTVSNLTVETSRTGTDGNASTGGVADSINQWNCFNFQDVPDITSRGTIVFRDIHVSECDFDVIHIGKNWETLRFLGFTLTDYFDIHRHVVYTNGRGGVFELNVDAGTYYLDTLSENNAIEIVDTPVGANSYTDLGDNNRIENTAASYNVNTSLGYTFREQAAHLRASDEALLYFPFDRGDWDGKVMQEKSKYYQPAQIIGAAGGVTIERTEIGDAAKFNGTAGLHFTPSFTTAQYDTAIFLHFKLYIDADTVTPFRILSGAGFLIDGKADRTIEFRITTTAGARTRSITAPNVKFRQWTSVSLRLSASGYELLYNDNYIASEAFVAPLAKSNAQCIIGYNVSGGSAVNFYLKDFYIAREGYDTAHEDAGNATYRSIPLASLTPNLPDTRIPTPTVLYYNPMDVTTNPSPDWSSSQLDGTLAGAPNVITNPLNKGAALNFKGAEKVTIAVDSLFFRDAFYVSGLFRVDTTALNRTLFLQTNGLACVLESVGLRYRMWEGGVQRQISTTRYRSSDRAVVYHVGIGKVGNKMYATLNGFIIDSLTVATTFDQNTNSLIIGSNATTGFHIGLVDEFLILDGFSPTIVNNAYQQAIQPGYIVPLDLPNPDPLTGTGTPGRSAQFATDGTLENGTWNTSGGITESTLLTAVGIARGTTAEAPAATTPGRLRWNTTTSRGTISDGTAHRDLLIATRISATIDFPDTPAHSTSTIDVSVAGLEFGQEVIITGPFGGYIFTGFANGGLDEVEVTYHNTSAAAVDLPNNTYIITVIK